MRDFTILAYEELIKTLKKDNLIFIRLEDYSDTTKFRLVILRHDVDCLPASALLMAEIENVLGVSASYYFRVARLSFNEEIMGQIAALGHEIGYHYETMDTHKGDIDKAYDEFCQNLERFRKIYPVKTICMHGSPFSRYDNKMLWEKYDYKKLGLIAEPYLDLDFTKVLYLTDTGRRWDGNTVNIRDKAIKDVSIEGRNIECKGLADKFSFKTTFDIIRVARNRELPDKIMINTHPQRWTDKPLPWFKELFGQNIKNIAKYIIVKVEGSK